jgi:hypothetical protein
MQVAIDRHRSPNRGQTGRLTLQALREQAVDAKLARPRVLALHVQHLFQEGQGQLIGGMGGRAGALIFQSGKAVVFKGGENPADMAFRKPQATSNALLLPAFIEHAHDGPAGTVSIVKVVEELPAQGELHGDSVLVKEVLDRMMIGGIAKFATQDADDFAKADRRIDLFEIEDVAGYRWRKVVGLASSLAGTLIDEAKHALLDKAPGFVPQDRPFNPDRVSASDNGLGAKHDRADGFVVVLHAIHKRELELMEIVGECGHSRPCWRTGGRASGGAQRILCAADCTTHQ